MISIQKKKYFEEKIVDWCHKQDIRYFGMRVCEREIINQDMMVSLYESMWERNNQPGYVGMPEKGKRFVSSYMNSSISFLVFKLKNLLF